MRALLGHHDELNGSDRWAVGLALVLALIATGVFTRPALAKLLVEDYQIIGEALHAADMDEWTRAERLMAGIDDPLTAKFLHWLLLVEDRKKAGFDELAQFIIESPTWPRIEELQILAEGRLTDSADKAMTMLLFEQRPPLTTRGRIRWAEALLAAGRGEAAVRQVKRAWTEGDFSKREEKSFLQRHQRHISRYDHERRLINMLWERNLPQARRMFSRVSEDYRRLAEARIALQEQAPGVDRAIAAVPEAFVADPGLAYDRIRWRRLKRKNDDAVALLLDPPEELGRPDQWWYERRFQIKRAIDRRDFAQAYQLASRHGQRGGGDYAEAEWLAGWLALRFNKQPKVAFRHFQRMYDRVVAPVRQARAAYWAGRAADAQKDWAGGTAWYRRGALHHVAYYGQLAAEELEVETAFQPPPDPTRNELAAFGVNEVAQTARMLIAAGAPQYLDAFLLALSDQAESGAEIGMVAELAVAGGRPNLLVRLGRQAAFEGKVYGPAAFPVPKIDGLLNPSAKTVEPALLLGMARQESMFQSQVASHAGARGLLQLLPSTARGVARQAGEDYDDERLSGDPDYNARLGGHYIEAMLERYDGEPVLALAAYNAGPLRVKRWMEKNGDPRTKDPHDMVDWVELIPFEETRNYVQRVMEGYRVYRHHLEDQNVALIDFPGGNGFGPPPLPAPRPKDLTETDKADTPASSDGPSHRPAFKPLGGSPAPAVAGSPEGASEGETPSPAAARSFDDQAHRRLAADDGRTGAANSPIN